MRVSINSVFMSNLKVNLGERSYDIIVGSNSLEKLQNFLQENSYSKTIVITDENVKKFHFPALQNIIKKTGKEFEVVTVEAGENSKSFSSLERVTEDILAKNIDRKSLIIAFGGGVVGDLAGFVAAILLRGVDFVQIPTTLLSMVDSSVGGKTAINSKVGKNLIGAFYQPKLVICDLELLKTIPVREFRSGYAEVVKYGLIRDVKFFDFLCQNRDKIFSNLPDFDNEIMAQIVTHSCLIKSQIVSEDEKESSGGVRALLNFGHTFGHALETELGYSDKLLHGEAVAIGMLMAAEMSCNLGNISREDVDLIKSHFNSVGLCIDPNEISASWNCENLVSHLYKDKKVENKNLNFILLKSIGNGYMQRSVTELEAKDIFLKFCNCKN